MKLFLNKGINIVVYPNNFINDLDNIQICKDYIITNKTNLLELQNNFLNLNNLNKTINLIFDKKNYTKEMNSFRKCILNKYFYKNSSIKIPRNIHFKILYKI